jgi:hypothetical protein
LLHRIKQSSESIGCQRREQQSISLLKRSFLRRKIYFERILFSCGLPYVADFLDNDLLQRPWGVISATSGKLLRSNDLLTHKGKPGGNTPTTTPALATGPGGNVKTGQYYYYGVDFPALPVGEDPSGNCSVP